MNRRAFTLIEMLMVIAIIATLISLLVPSVQKVREAAARTQTHMNMMQLVLAVQSCNDVHDKLPPATGWFGRLRAPNEKTVEGIAGTLHVHLLPFVEQDDLYFRILEGKAVLPPGQVQGGFAPGELPPPFNDVAAVPVYQSPSDPTLSARGSPAASFAANLRVFSDVGLATKWDAAIQPGPGGLNAKTGFPWYYGAASLPDSIPDGLSNTIAFTTQYSECGEKKDTRWFFNSAGAAVSSPFFGFHAPQNPAAGDGGVLNGVQGEIFQISPLQINCNPNYTPQSLSTGGLSVALFDGSVRLLNAGISVQTWGKAVQPNDGLVLGSDWN